MSLLDASCIRVIAESVGIAQVSDEVAEALAPDVEYRLRDIVQEALKFMRHGRRETLTCDDINFALRARSCDPLYGYSGTDPPRFCRAKGTQDVYYLDDAELNLADLMAVPLPSMPRPPRFTAHWLAVSGVQPDVAENPTSAEALAAAQPARAAASKRKRGGGNGGGDGLNGDEALLGQAKQVLWAEQQVWLEKLFEIIRASKPAAPQPAAPQPAGGGGGAAMEVVGECAAAPATSHPGGEAAVAASRAAGISLDSSAERAEAEAAQRRDAEAEGGHEAALGSALRSVAREPSMHAYAPYLCQFVESEVQRNLQCLPMLFALMRLVRAMLSNLSLNLEAYLQQILPAVTTCVVGRKLCAARGDDHWSLRAIAAGVMHTIAAQYGDRFTDLQPRLTKTYRDALEDRKRALTTHFGALLGLREFGPHAVHKLLLPMMPAYLQLVHGVMSAPLPDAAPAAAPAAAASDIVREMAQEPGDAAPASAASESTPAPSASPAAPPKRARLVRQMEALRVYDAALATCGAYLFRHGHYFAAPPALLPRLATSYETLSAEFGPALLAYSRVVEPAWDKHARRSLQGAFL